MIAAAGNDWWATGWNSLSIPTVDGHTYRIYAIGAWD